MRLVSCKDDIQWIIQTRSKTAGDNWRATAGQAYWRTRDPLLRHLERTATLPDSARKVLHALPERHA